MSASSSFVGSLSPLSLITGRVFHFKIPRARPTSCESAEPGPVAEGIPAKTQRSGEYNWTTATRGSIDMATGDQKPALTPAMIEAGIQAFYDAGLKTDRDVVVAIYHAMRSKSQKCDCQDGE